MTLLLRGSSFAEREPGSWAAAPWPLHDPFPQGGVWGGRGVRREQLGSTGRTGQGRTGRQVGGTGSQQGPSSVAQAASGPFLAVLACVSQARGRVPLPSRRGLRVQPCGDHTGSVSPTRPVSRARRCWAGSGSLHSDNSVAPKSPPGHGLLLFLNEWRVAGGARPWGGRGRRGAGSCHRVPSKWRLWSELSWGSCPEPPRPQDQSRRWSPAQTPVGPGRTGRRLL